MREGNYLRSFTQLDAWKKAHRLVILIYQITKSFPKEEQFGLTIQIRRAVVSITSNISEGFGRKSKKQKIQFYSISFASLNEVQNQLLISRDIGYLAKDRFNDIAKLTIEVKKLINSLISTTKERSD